ARDLSPARADQLLSLTLLGLPLPSPKPRLVARDPAAGVEDHDAVRHLEQNLVTGIYAERLPDSRRQGDLPTVAERPVQRLCHSQSNQPFRHPDISHAVLHRARTPIRSESSMSTNRSILPLTGERTVPGIPHENYWFRRHEAAYGFLLPYAGVRTVLDVGCGE